MLQLQSFLELRDQQRHKPIIISLLFLGANTCNAQNTRCRHQVYRVLALSFASYCRTHGVIRFYGRLRLLEPRLA